MFFAGFAAKNMQSGAGVRNLHVLRSPAAKIPLLRPPTPASHLAPNAPTPAPKRPYRKKPMRNSNIELLRILAMFLIVVHHLSVQTAWPDLSSDLAVQSAVRALAFGGKIGVDIFVIITGYFMISSCFKVRSLLRTVTETWFYSWTLLAMFLIAGWGISKMQIAESIAPIFTGEYWFISTYLLLYLFIPLLNRVLRPMSKRSWQLLLAVSFTVLSLVPTLTTYSPVSENVIWFFFLYAVGGYLRLFEGTGEASGARDDAAAASHDGAAGAGSGDGSRAQSGRSPLALRLLNPAELVSHHPLAWCLGSFAVVVGSIVGFTYAHAMTGFDFMWWSSLMMQHKVPALLMAVSLFVLFRRMPMGCVPAINLAGGATFGVYLIHEQQFVRSWLWSKAQFLVEPGSAFVVIVGGLAFCLVVYAVCTAVDIVRKKAIEDPLMRWLNARFAERFDMIDEAMALK